MADITGTTADKWLGEFWSPMATVTYRSNTVLVPLMDHSWEEELRSKGIDTVNIPAFSQNSAANKRTTFGTGAALTFDAVTESQVQLVINNLVYKGYKYPVELGPQFLMKYTDRLTDGIGTAVALKVDEELAADNTNGLDSFTTVVGTDNIDISDDNLLTCQENLDGQNAPLKDRFVVIGVKSRTSLMKIDYIRNSLYGRSGSIDPKAGAGHQGPYLTFDFYMSNNLEAGASGRKNAAWQREAIAYADQISLQILSDTNIEDGLFRQVVGYQTYGFKKVKDAFGNELDGK